MHYGINSRLLSMQQQKLGQRRRCAGCCLSHYCHCAIWAMPSCHVVSYLLFFNSSYIDFTSLWNQRQIEYFHLPLSSSGRSRSWVSASIRQFPHWHCSTAALSQWSRRGDSETAVTHHNHRNTSASTTNTASSTTLICLPPPQYPDDKWITSSHLNMISTAPEATTKHWHWSLNLI